MPVRWGGKEIWATSFRGRGFFIVSYIYCKILNKRVKKTHFLYYILNV